MHSDGEDDNYEDSDWSDEDDWSVQPRLIYLICFPSSTFVYVCLTKQSNDLKDTDKITLSWNSRCVRWTLFHSLIHVFSLLQMFYIPPKICYLEINVGFLSWNTTLDHQPTVCRHALWRLLVTTVSNSLACMKYLRMTNARSSQVHHNYVCKVTIDREENHEVHILVSHMGSDHNCPSQVESQNQLSPPPNLWVDPTPRLVCRSLQVFLLLP